MTPPPPSHLLQQNRNLPTPPANLQTQMAAMQYNKYHYMGNMNVTPPIGSAGSQNSGSGGRTARNTASAPVQHMGGGGAGSVSNRGSPNVTLSSMSPYGSPLNGYRMAAAQQAAAGSAVASYITNSAAAAGFINNPAVQLPGQMSAMNMQSQYQDPAALQRAAQQNSMYPGYPYPGIPLNGTMRR